MLATLPAGTAAADNGDDLAEAQAEVAEEVAEAQVEVAEEAVEARAELLEARVEALELRARLAAADPLHRVVDVNGDDFDRGSEPENRDPLAWGFVRLVRDEPSVDPLIQVALGGAAADASYEVVFLGIRDNRVGLGWVRTFQSGAFEGLARSNQDNTGEPRRLGGGNRVGVFVLTRDGKDQFVTGLTTRAA
jgi:hypothetical protein